MQSNLNTQNVRTQRQYITVGELWELALPPETMFGDKGYRTGLVNPGLHTGTSTGLVAYGFSPRDYFYITLKCVRSGSVNRLNTDNPSGLPVFQVSQFNRILIGGQANGSYILPKSSGSIELVDPGTTNLVTYITVVGNDIKVFLRRNETQFLATEAEVKSAILADSSAMALIKDISLNPNTDGKLIAKLIGPIDFGPEFISAVMRVTPDQNKAYIDIPENGLRFSFENNGSTDPAFILNDTWTFDTAPSKELVKIIQAASDYCDQYISATYDLVLNGWGEDFKMVVAQIARWYLLTRRGLDAKQEFKVYEPTMAMKWLKDAQGGSFQKGQKLVEKAPGTFFAELIRGRNILDDDFPI